MEQLLLPFSVKPFTQDIPVFTDATNQSAWSFIQMWPNWPGRGMILYGPKGSGKSYLAHIWRQHSKAKIWPLKNGVDSLFEGDPPHIFIENFHHYLDEPTQCEDILRAYNILRERKGSCLLTDIKPLTQRPILPDLSSRLKTLCAMEIHVPSDHLLFQVADDLFKKNQLRVSSEVIYFLIPRIERSMTKIKTLVTTLSQESLRHQRPITIDFVKKIIPI